MIKRSLERGQFTVNAAICKNETKKKKKRKKKKKKEEKRNTDPFKDGPFS